MEKRTRRSLEEAIKRHQEGYESLSEAETLGIEILIRPEIVYKGKLKNYKLWRVELTGQIIEKITEKYGEQTIERLFGRGKTVGGAIEELFFKMKKIGVYNFLYGNELLGNN